MYFKKSPGFVTILSAILTVMLVISATTIGAYAGNGNQNNGQHAMRTVLMLNKTASASPTKDEEPVKVEGKESLNGRSNENNTYFSKVEQCYENGSIAYLAYLFGQIDEDGQKRLLDKMYTDGNMAAFSAGVMQLKVDSPLIQYFAEKAYADDAVSFFSVLVNYMDSEMPEIWQEKAMEERKISFQSVLFNAMGKTDELQKMKEEEDTRILEEYGEYGITKEGTLYFYKGQSVRILLDIRSDQSFVVLNMEPKGEVAIRITRNPEGKIARIDYMTEEEIAELLTDKDEEPDDLD